MGTEDEPLSAPLFITVGEAAQLLGISRSLAYELANRWIETGRSDGIPAIRLGRRLLVNRPALYELAEDTAMM